MVGLHLLRAVSLKQVNIYILHTHVQTGSCVSPSRVRCSLDGTMVTLYCPELPNQTKYARLSEKGAECSEKSGQ